MSLLACFAVAIIVEGALYWIFGANVRHAARVLRQRRASRSPGSTSADIYLFGFALAVAAVAAIYLLLYRTQFGRASAPRCRTRPPPGWSASTSTGSPR